MLRNGGTWKIKLSYKCLWCDYVCVIEVLITLRIWTGPGGGVTDVYGSKLVCYQILIFIYVSILVYFSWSFIFLPVLNFSIFELMKFWNYPGVVAVTHISLSKADAILTSFSTSNAYVTNLGCNFLNNARMINVSDN